MKNIVIIGAGFAGMATALGLEKNNKDISITLVDKHDYQLFYPNLFEVATSEEELVSVGQIKKSIALPIREIIKNKKINFVLGELKDIDHRAKTVTVGIKKIYYDYLILAFGNKVDFYKVEGAKEFALPLNSLPDALRIRNAVEFSIQSHAQDFTKQVMRFVVAGGGYTGVELAGELKNLVEFLSWKYSFPKKYIEIIIVESSAGLVLGFGKNFSEDVFARMQDLGIRILLHQRIIKADHHFIEFLGGEKMHYELLFWAGGVKAEDISVSVPLIKKNKDRIETNQFLQAKGIDNIFIAGDAVYFEEKSGLPVYQTMENAVDQGKYLAYALPLIFKNQKPKAFVPKDHGSIVRVSGKWGILKIKPFYFKGYIAYLASIFKHFLYYYSLLGFKKAIRYVILEMDVFGRND